MKYGKSLIAALLGASTLLSAAAMAKNVEVTAEGTKFTPLVVHIQPGDTVSWTNMSGHTTHSLDAQKLTPKGGQTWQSAMGDNFQTKPFKVQGVYMYKCDPHWGFGMGGVIIVGKPTNMAEIKKHAHGPAHMLYNAAKKSLK